jgi:hypothetical protein
VAVKTLFAGLPCAMPEKENGVRLIKSTAAILYSRRDTIPKFTVVKVILGKCGC